MQVDKTGKVSLGHIYTQPDPRPYFTTLRDVDYVIPQLAKPYFGKLIEEYRQAHRTRIPTVLDLGCSYGINAALLKCDASMDELYDRYMGKAHLDHGTLLERDRELVAGGLPNLRFVGLDASRPALSYAHAAGFVDAAVNADLEARDPTPGECEILATADVVISTGCLGYITEKTISRIVAACGEHRPWMAHFVLRMFPFDPVADTLAAAGYRTHRREGMFRQRRFAGPLEQTKVLATLTDVGVDPTGLETEGWLYAELYISRPEKRPDQRDLP